ncbi:phosphoribosylformylglycinamidine synthase [Ichthyobacterium seriolicida]|uniref:Phosphoribosylformylglycinamidine synthase, synthetase subunit n=1 Tax=Ichthyobacterium seriolicida TaxID=242600 RepID=A0A1J1DWG7_9FLAO|nr:phosphoribosylformylglycinamidine synthase [Ichthyobacterium seriolicida]BAV94209.1 phosphoribosylformylglycinamidine synthase, synthetase subunit [Ichthyobacterium seriolicida]
MVQFYKNPSGKVYFVVSSKDIDSQTQQKLEWLFGEAQKVDSESLKGYYLGPSPEMISPWSTNAVDITVSMGIEGIQRIEEFQEVYSEEVEYDSMLQKLYKNICENSLETKIKREDIIFIDDIDSYNIQEGLALNQNEINYLNQLSLRLNRKLTDSEVFGFSQINSEHCRHKIFNSKYIIDGQEKDHTLFELIKDTSKKSPDNIVSAYKDNVAFVKGDIIEQFAPEKGDQPSSFKTKNIDAVLSLKAETHNFPTTVEPFNGAATGSGGEIRDRLAGGKGSLPLIGTAVYMTSYSRLKESVDSSLSSRFWEKATEPRDWLYQTPSDILIKASNGASDFGNKFGQPLICGSVLSFEHFENDEKYGFDKVVMLAGGVGYAKKEDSFKSNPEEGDVIVIIGGDNYRIGMGGSSVSSVDTGDFRKTIELSAIQRSNPEMQKRVANVIRSMVESDDNIIVSIHDHGAGGHLNCLSELVEKTGAYIDLNKLPIGDKTLSAKELIGNESQERMGLIVKPKDLPILQRIAKREKAPLYVVGEVRGDKVFRIECSITGEKPIDLNIEDIFENTPQGSVIDKSVDRKFSSINYDVEKLDEYLSDVLKLEAVACKDWLTNKVDRCVTGRVARQQTVGSLQLPLSDVGVVALDYRGNKGIATSIGHSPVTALIDPVGGSRNSIAEALTNLIWAPLSDRLDGVSLSANWMWSCGNEGEDHRLYEAVKGLRDFAVELGINIPTGKDSLSMTQKYPDGDPVYSPGTVIISAIGKCQDVKKVIKPVFNRDKKSNIYYIDLSGDAYSLGGSSFAQIVNKIGDIAPTIRDVKAFKCAFNTVQDLILEDKILAGHDISAGGIITTLLEMCFAENDLGAEISLGQIGENDIIKLLFSENAGIIFQAKDDVEEILESKNINYKKIGKVTDKPILKIVNMDNVYNFDIQKLRDEWYETSYLLDSRQSGKDKARERFENYKKQPLYFSFPKYFTGKFRDLGISPDRKQGPKIKAAVIREKGSNTEREMAYALYLAGFDVLDVHMTDLMSGREDLKDVNFIAAIGGFSNSDVLNSAKGWAGSFKYNNNAKKALYNFFDRNDTLSIGVCNGCQLFIELGLITPSHSEKPKMSHNDSNKFESAFINIYIPRNDSVMLHTLSDTRLGIWTAHGEGKFNLPYEEDKYNIVGKYAYSEYPANPNGSDYETMALSTQDGRHIAMMPHLDRSIFPWNWAHYPDRDDQVSPWIEAFINARKWIENNGV